VDLYAATLPIQWFCYYGSTGFYVDQQSYRLPVIGTKGLATFGTFQQTTTLALPPLVLNMPPGHHVIIHHAAMTPMMVLEKNINNLFMNLFKIKFNCIFITTCLSICDCNQS
jgi:hypothetical protein